MRKFFFLIILLSGTILLCWSIIRIYSVAYKPNPDLEKNGWTPLAAALDNGNMVVAKHLLGNDKNPQFRGLPLVVFFSDGLHDSPQIIKFLIENEVNKSSYPQAFLHSAQCNDTESVKLFLDAGVNVNTKDDNGINALFYTENAELAKELISRGIDKNNEAGLKTVWNNFLVLQILVENGVHIPISHENANRGLRKAALLGDEQNTSYFLSRGADVNSCDTSSLNNNRNASGQTALMLNAVQGYPQCGWGGSNQVSPAVANILLKAGADINAKDASKRTALHHLAVNQSCRFMPGPIPMGTRYEREQGFHGDPSIPPEQYHDSIMVLLLKKGARLNETDNEGNTPLLIAAMFRNYKALELLLKFDAKMEIKNNKGNTFFDYINDSGSLKVIKDAGLINHIPQSVRDRAFEWFIYDCNRNSKYDSKIAESLIDCGVNVNYAFDGDENALMFVLDRFYSGIKKSAVEHLVTLGTNLKMADREKKTALHYAVEKKDVSAYIVDFLIKKGADIEAKDNSMLTPLTVANVMNKKEHAQILIKAGAKRDITAEWWFTIYENWYHDDNRIVAKLEKLLDEGVDINTKLTHDIRPTWSSKMPGCGMTALMYLSQKGKIEAVKSLLSRGASLDIKDDNGVTALNYSKKESRTEMINFLVEKGAK